MSIDAAFNYSDTKQNIINDMKQSSKATIVSLKKNLANLISSYSINEYDNLVQNEIASRDIFAIVVEDYNTAKILGREIYVSGKIRDVNNKIIDFDSDNAEHQKLIDECYYSEKYDITSSAGNKLGKVSIYISNQSMTSELNNIISSNIINSLAISLLLILILFLAIHLFILKPISNMNNVIMNTDDEGIPLELIPLHGAAEIYSLSDTMNNMIRAIRYSRVKLKEQHNEIVANEDQLRTLSMATEQSPVSVIICTPENIIEYINPQFEKTSGISENEVLGKSVEFLFEYREQDQKQLNGLRATLESKKQWVGEISPVTKDNKNYFLRMSASPIADDDGKVTHNIYVAEDITEHVQNELLVRTSQKMDAIGQLTGGIAHDFNNLLGIIMGNLELLELDLADNPKAIEKIKQALAGTTRGAQLTRKLLNFSRQDTHIKELIQINPFIENLHDLIAKSVTAIIQVEINLAENLWSSEIDPGDFEDALLNLALNARDAMPDGGLLLIETANKYLDANYVNQNPTAKVGDFVMVSVTDTGTGIPEEERKRIFDPFYTTKEFGKGSGLGLSMVYGFVQRSGGHIQIYSEEGKGSSFQIYLPRAHGKQENDAISEERIDIPKGNETILVVDDEKTLADTAKIYLERLGYTPILASSAKEAMEILVNNQDISLVFSDVVMPVTDGFELSSEIQKQWPEMKILLTSGFSSKRSEFMNGYNASYLKLAENLLDKPYNMKELAMAVRKALDE